MALRVVAEASRGIRMCGFAKDSGAGGRTVSDDLLIRIVAKAVHASGPHHPMTRMNFSPGVRRRSPGPTAAARERVSINRRNGATWL
jgi:hypothetical protein